MHFKNLQVNSAVLKRSVYSLFIAEKMLDDSRVNTHQENLVRYLQKMMKMIFHHMGRQAEMRLKKGIEYFIYLTYNETCIKLCGPCGNRSSYPKVVSPEVMVPETRAMTPESFSLVAKNDECLVSCDITSGKMTFGQLDHKPAPPYVCLMKDST